MSELEPTPWTVETCAPGDEERGTPDVYVASQGRDDAFAHAKAVADAGRAVLRIRDEGGAVVMDHDQIWHQIYPTSDA